MGSSDEGYHFMIYKLYKYTFVQELLRLVRLSEDELS